jgi:hypothetical protein
LDKKVVCVNCKKEFWSKVTHNVVTKGQFSRRVEVIDTLCRNCANRMRMMAQKRKDPEDKAPDRIRALPPANLRREIEFLAAFEKYSPKGAEELRKPLSSAKDIVNRE